MSDGAFIPDETRSGRFKKAEASAKDAFLLSRKLKLHWLRPGCYESPCGMASMVKTGYKKLEELPETFTSMCKPCFKTDAEDEVRNRYGKLWVT